MKDLSLPPLSESYWVVPNRLLAGEHPGGPNEELTRQRIDALLEARIDTFIDLTRPEENLPYSRILQGEAEIYDVRTIYQCFPIGDLGLPTTEQMNSILNSIEESLHAGRKIYLHCWGGIGRTGTTVGCYLVRQGRTGEEALDQLAIWWQSVPKSRYHPYSPETPRQIDFILTWATHDQKFRP